MADLLDRLKTALADRYAIEEEIGAGGMATVYLAEDLKHHRKVAVKVLRPELAATLGPERFLREIEVAANLTHPHILPLFDSGDADGFLYYVMPYIEGESLRAKLAREGELPIAEAVKILREVVDALASAHKHGVVHRDIKPDNVLLSEKHAMVTDFGIAKAVSEATGREKLTTAGVALGTPAYMAPEQASASPHIDHRADIYAVVALAYELLTGRPPFTGTTPQMVLAAHVTETAEPVTKHRQAVPPVLAHFVMKCLEKKPSDRWQTAEELLAQLDAVATPSGGLTPTDTRPVQATARPVDKKRVAIGAVVVLGVVIGGVLLLPGREVEYRIGRTQQVTRASGMELDPAISPDGSMVAYAAGPQGQMQLYVRQLAGGRDIPLTEEVSGHHRWPKWSPDGSRIAFQTLGSSGWSIHVVPSLGGIPTPLVRPDSAGGQGAHSPAWSPDGSAIAYVVDGSLYTRPLAGGEATKLVDYSTISTDFPGGIHSPSWSPDGSRIAYVGGAFRYLFSPTIFGTIRISSLWVVLVAGGEPVRLTSGQAVEQSPTWTPDGESLLFVSNRDGKRDIHRVGVRKSGAPIGEPERLTTDLDAHTITLSQDGQRLAYSALTFRANVWSVAIPTSGSVSVSTAQPVTNENQVVEGIGVSRDGRWLAFDSDRSGNQDIFKMPAGGGEVQQLTTHASNDFRPVWSPDGSEIAFYSLRNGSRDIYVMSADAVTLQRVTNAPGQEVYPDWSPDGEQLVFSGGGSIRVVSRDDGRARWGETRKIADGNFPRWSPDGKLIAYVRQGGAYIIGSEGGDPRLLEQSAAFVRWSLDGGTLYFTNTDGIWSVPVGGGTARILVRFDDPSRRPSSLEFDTDGRRFFFMIEENESDISVLELLRN